MEYSQITLERNSDEGIGKSVWNPYALVDGENISGLKT